MTPEEFTNQYETLFRNKFSINLTDEEKKILDLRIFDDVYDHIRAASQHSLSFLSNQDRYTQVRQMFLEDRVRLVHDNAFSTASLNDVIRSARRTKSQISTVYLSNALIYVRNPGLLRRFFGDLAIHDPVMLMTTQRKIEGPSEDIWKYWLIGAKQFHEKMQRLSDFDLRDKVQFVKNMLETGVDEFMSFSPLA